ncbi:MAG TPA: aldose 1-epimerase [bacterium]|nr:aldose 1-epimerase [bacterium]HPP11688.1 aldose 1-epimerase [bacterium]
MLTRPDGCRWAEYSWKNLRLLFMENDLLRLQILLDKGTDIVEFLYKPADLNFLWRSPTPFYQLPRISQLPPGATGCFLDAYPGGWQEIFPNAGLPCQYKGASLGLHGEVALLPWDYQVLVDTAEQLSLCFSVFTVRTPFSLRKILTLKRGQPSLTIEEEVTNLAAETMDFCWGHHPALGPPFLSSECRIKLAGATVTVCPGDGQAVTNLAPGKGSWPLVAGKDGKIVDISLSPGEDDCVSDNILLTDLSEGAYEIVNSRLKIGFRLEFSLDVFRCLWFWRVARGSFHYPWYGRTYTVALEPFSSLPQLSEAVKRGDQLTLAPGGKMAAKLVASVVSLQ